jgi:hypothetical protein
LPPVTPLPAPTACARSLSLLRRQSGCFPGAQRFCTLLSLSGTRRCLSASTWSSRIHLPARPSLGAVLLSSPPVVRAPDHLGTMRALTPAPLRRRSRPLRSIRIAFPASRPQPRCAARRHVPITSCRRSTSWVRLRPLWAGSSLHPAESGSLSYGLSVRLRLLPTPSPAFAQLADAVAFGYMCGDFTWHRLPLC